MILIKKNITILVFFLVFFILPLSYAGFLIAAVEPPHCALLPVCVSTFPGVLLPMPLALFSRDPLLSRITFALSTFRFVLELVSPAPHVPQLDPIEVERWIAA